MCFVRALKHGLTAKYEAPILSHQMIVGLSKGCRNSLSKDRSQISSAVVFATALYSASVEDLATVGCFLADQEIKFVPK